MRRSLHRLPLWVLALTLVLAAALPAISTQAQTQMSEGSGRMIKGSGKLVEQERAVGAFNALRLEGSFKVEAQQGSTPRVTVSADDNLIDLIETVVENDTLVIRTKHKASWRTTSPLVVKVGFGPLRRAELRGSGDLKLRGLQSAHFSASVAGTGDMHMDAAQLGELQVSVAGSGDLIASGSARQVRVQLAGSGDVDLSRLQSRHSKVSLAGSGDVSVQASASADVSIAGSGDVRIYGKPPSVSRSVAGSGDIVMR